MAKFIAILLCAAFAGWCVYKMFTYKEPVQ